MSDIKWTPKEQLIFIKDQLNMAKSMMKDRSDLSYSYIDNAFKMIKSLDEELEAVSPKWISVTKKLPEKNQMVLVFTDVGGQLVVPYRMPYWKTLSVLYWMPLPEPPTQTSEEG